MWTYVDKTSLRVYMELRNWDLAEGTKIYKYDNGWQEVKNWQWPEEIRKRNQHRLEYETPYKVIRPGEGHPTYIITGKKKDKVFVEHGEYMVGKEISIPTFISEEDKQALDNGTWQTDSLA